MASFDDALATWASRFLARVDRAQWLFFALDTTYDAQSRMRPFLRLVAFDGDLQKGLERAAATGDSSHVDDALDEVALTEDQLPLAELFPRWPEDFEVGSAALRLRFEALLARRAPLFARISDGCWMHWAGTDVFSPLTRG
jgi:hypothetical protein